MRESIRRALRKIEGRVEGVVDASHKRAVHHPAPTEAEMVEIVRISQDVGVIPPELDPEALAAEYMALHGGDQGSSGG